MKERLIKITIENIRKDASKKHSIEIKNYNGWIIVIVGLVSLLVIFKEEIFNMLSAWLLR